MPKSRNAGFSRPPTARNAWAGAGLPYRRAPEESAFANAEFDALLGKALAFADADQRRDVLAELQKIMHDERMIFQLHWRSIYRHHKENLVKSEMQSSFTMHSTELAFST